MVKQIVIYSKQQEEKSKELRERLRRESAKMRYTPKERQVYLKALRYGRRQKVGGEFKAVPRVKFNGGSLGVRRDSKGNVHIVANNREGYKVTELGPTGARRSIDLSYLNDKQTSKASKMINSLFKSVSKGKYKFGSTGSKGG
ncbi:hypothetical protein [Limosilactobacillus reuteri]|uniref:hypothetical protein n=1 Tax=Limosilactobacillus reuteri TaxID=1598 RepID=UPI002B054EA1|nr:hypothetical protein [Limosilactobacillus reuteri]